MSAAIETYSGIMFDVACPDPALVRIDDIAWALSRQARYAGHTLGPTPYSVAQHSVHVMRLVDQALTAGDPLNAAVVRAVPKCDWLHEWLESEWLRAAAGLEALMHDGSEAYLVDLPSPVKRSPGISEAYGVMEASVTRAIAAALKLPDASMNTLRSRQLRAIVHWADMYARAIEAHHLIRSRGAAWGAIDLPQPPSTEQLHAFVMPVLPMEACSMFLGAYADATEQLRLAGGDK